MLCVINVVVGIGAHYHNLICERKSSDLLGFRQNHQTVILLFDIYSAGLQYHIWQILS